MYELSLLWDTAEMLDWRLFGQTSSLKSHVAPIPCRKCEHKLSLLRGKAEVLNWSLVGQEILGNYNDPDNLGIVVIPIA